jgi:hypothetical protein
MDENYEVKFIKSNLAITFQLSKYTFGFGKKIIY